MYLFPRLAAVCLLPRSERSKPDDLSVVRTCLSCDVAWFPTLRSGMPFCWRLAVNYGPSLRLRAKIGAYLSATLG